MPINAKTLVESVAIDSALTTHYTVPVTATIVDKCTAINHDLVPRTISVFLMPAGVPAANSNLAAKDKILQPSEAYTFPEVVGHILNTGDAIATLCDGSFVVNFRVSGREIS